MRTRDCSRPIISLLPQPRPTPSPLEGTPYHPAAPQGDPLEGGDGSITETPNMIYGERIRLWALERHDLLKNYQWANMRVLIRLAGMTPYPKSANDLERWYESSQANGNEKIFSIKTHEGEYLGNIELRDIDWWSGKAELGIVIGEAESMQQGIGREAVNLLCQFAFEQMRLERISARVLEFNIRAQKTFEACGFVREGRERKSHFSDGVHHDVCLFSRLKSDPMEES
jgi:ribosomal-protein-alanine N-acetyltransferase